MCGIAGIYSLERKTNSESLVRKMTNAIAHRGPDGEGVYAEDNITLGHRRLSIIDLSDTGRQPMRTEDGQCVITYNGEIYNFPELKEELIALGHKFSSKSDTEVILKGYQQWGLDIIPKLNGMFAFA